MRKITFKVQEKTASNWLDCTNGSTTIIYSSDWTDLNTIADNWITANHAAVMSAFNPGNNKTLRLAIEEANEVVYKPLARTINYTIQEFTNKKIWKDIPGANIYSEYESTLSQVIKSKDTLTSEWRTNNASALYTAWNGNSKQLQIKCDEQNDINYLLL